MNKKIEKMVVISPGYPYKGHSFFSFVDQLLCAISDQNVECVVISPQSISKNIKVPQFKRERYWKKSHNNKQIEVYQPLCFTFSNLKLFGISLTDVANEIAIRRTFRKIVKKNSIDAVYGHFWVCGLIAAKLGKKYGIPSFVACGESKIPTIRRNLKFKEYLRGVICVSSKSQKESVNLKLCTLEKTIVCPNAIDNNLFYQKDRLECRKKLDLPEDVFIVSFVGSFTERKGSKRLSKALDRFDDAYSIFIGSGSEVPECKNRLVTSSVPHDQLGDYLCAADVFVLPTLNEGCCNAIVEAMACGLPIISSDLPFNSDILDDTNAVLINPNDVDEIFRAIQTIKNNTNLKIQKGKASLEKSKNLIIENRAKIILDFINERK